MCLLMAILGLLLLFCLGLFYLINFAFDFSFGWFYFLLIFFVDFFSHLIFFFKWFFYQMIYFSLNPLFRRVYTILPASMIVYTNPQKYLWIQHKRNVQVYICINMWAKVEEKKHKSGKSTPKKNSLALTQSNLMY